MKNEKILLLLVVCLTLAACGFGTPPMLVSQAAIPQANLMIECEEQPPLKPGQDAVENHIETMSIFHNCKAKVRGWIDWYEETEGKP